MNTLPAVAEFRAIPTPVEIFGADKASLPARRRRLDAAMKPMPRNRCQKAVFMLLAQIPKHSETMIGDPKVFTSAMVEELSEFPEVVVNEAIRVARRKFVFMPSIAEMYGLCDELMKKMRRSSRALRIWQSGPQGERDYFFMVEYMAELRRRKEIESAAQRPPLPKQEDNNASTD